jgi:hypothetical protein
MPRNSRKLLAHEMVFFMSLSSKSLGLVKDQGLMPKKFCRKADLLNLEGRSFCCLMKIDLIY